MFFLSCRRRDVFLLTPSKALCRGGEAVILLRNANLLPLLGGAAVNDCAQIDTIVKRHFGNVGDIGGDVRVAPRAHGGIEQKRFSIGGIKNTVDIAIGGIVGADRDIDQIFTFPKGEGANAFYRGGNLNGAHRGASVKGAGLECPIAPFTKLA